MKQLIFILVFFTSVIAQVNAQEPSLPKAGTWGTYSETQTILVESKNNPSFAVEIKAKPTKKVVMACHYTNEITNKSDKDVSFVIGMISPKGPTSSDDSKVKLKAGETKEVSFLLELVKAKVATRKSLMVAAPATSALCLAKFQLIN